MSAETIYKELVSAGMTPEGACGMLGNMYAESTLRADNAQDSMTSMADAEYTAAVDNGTYDSFTGDGVGYGLCQWTFYSRKAALLAFAKNRGTSVGDEEMQAEFVIKELKNDYPALWTYLCSTTDIGEAADRVCREYEKPAVNNTEYRGSKAREYYAALAGTETATEPEEPSLGDALTNESVMHLQAILASYGYDLSTAACPSGVDGYIGKKTVAALKDFAERLATIV